TRWRISLRIDRKLTRSGGIVYQLLSFWRDTLRTLEGRVVREGRTRMRADARDNRQRLLLAARDVFSERGPAAPLDEIARRAGTGIATLYRHFPDREALMLEVVRDAIELSIEE